MRAFGGEGNLQWQRPNLPQSHQSQSREPLNPRPSLREVPATTKPNANTPRATTTKKVYAVQQATFTQEEGWARSDRAHTLRQTQHESVVIRRDDSFDSFDLAQAPDGLPAPQPLEEDFESQIELPFGDPTTPDEILQRPQETTQPQPATQPPFGEERQPREFDPLGQPGDTPPTPFDRQPQPDTTRDPGLPSQQPTFDPIPQPSTERAVPARRSLGTGIAATPEERQLAEETCAKELDAIRASRIATINLEITPTGEPGRDFPFECSIDDGTPYGGRHWSEITYMWKAAANCHKPLYFEQVQAERYGHSVSPCLQPFCSGAHFFGSLVTLPYQMGLTPPNECMYPLGHYRPGNCAPYMVPAVPFTWRAVGAQAGAAVGVSAILP